MKSGWRELNSCLSSAEMDLVRSVDVAAPYYGDILYELTMQQSSAGPEPIAQSAASAPSDEAQFYIDALEDFVPALGINESQVRAGVGVTDPAEQGLPHDRRLLALLRAIESVSPLKGRLILRFLPQAFVYLNRAAAAEAVDDTVRPTIAGDRSVVVAHSLGTIVAYKLLRDGGAFDVPFLLTLGSPLAVKAVQLAIGPPFHRPEPVGSWLNGLDPDDAVTIGRKLTDATFGPGVRERR